MTEQQKHCEQKQGTVPKNIVKKNKEQCLRKGRGGYKESKERFQK